MDRCNPPFSWSYFSWPPEYAVLAFARHASPSDAPEDASNYTWSTHTSLKPTSTSFYVPPQALHLVISACSVPVIVGLISSALVLTGRQLNIYLRKPAPAVLSQETILRIHGMASRVPYNMPPDDGGDDGTFPALPFAGNPYKQSLFIFWLFLFVIGCLASYALKSFWLPAASSYVAAEYNRLSWTVTVILSALLANLSSQFLPFVFFIWPAVQFGALTAQWVVLTICLQPAFAAQSAHYRITQVVNYTSHWCFEIPFDQPLPHYLNRSATVLSGALSALGGYHLISSRVARNYMLIVKSIVQVPQQIARIYHLALQRASILPTTHLQTWAWWLIRHALVFVLGDLSWNSISQPKPVTLVVPSLIVCAHGIYKYSRVVVRPRSPLQVALDPIYLEQRRLAVETAEMHRILRSLERQLANAIASRELSEAGVEEQE